MTTNSAAAPIDLLSRALLATRNRAPHLTERMLLLQVQRDGSEESEQFLPIVDHHRRQQLKHHPSFSPLKKRASTTHQRGRGRGRRQRSRQHQQQRNSPPRVRKRMELIEATSPYNPKLLLARALSEARHYHQQEGEMLGGTAQELLHPPRASTTDPSFDERRRDRSRAGTSSSPDPIVEKVLLHGTSHASLLARQQHLIDQHGIGLWDRIVGGSDPAQALKQEQQQRRRRANTIRALASAASSSSSSRASLSQYRGKELRSGMMSDLKLAMRRDLKSQDRPPRLMEDILMQEPSPDPISNSISNSIRNRRPMSTTTTLASISPVQHKYNTRPYTMETPPQHQTIQP